VLGEPLLEANGADVNVNYVHCHRNSVTVILGEPLLEANGGGVNVNCVHCHRNSDSI
jgi:hypothetical protein